MSFDLSTSEHSRFALQLLEEVLEDGKLDGADVVRVIRNVGQYVLDSNNVKQKDLSVYVAEVFRKAEKRLGVSLPFGRIDEVVKNLKLDKRWSLKLVSWCSPWVIVE